MFHRPHRDPSAFPYPTFGQHVSTEHALRAGELVGRERSLAWAGGAHRGLRRDRSGLPRSAGCRGWGARSTSRHRRQLFEHLTVWSLERGVRSPSTLDLRAHGDGGEPTEPPEASARGAAPSSPAARSPSRSCRGPLRLTPTPDSTHISQRTAHRPSAPRRVRPASGSPSCGRPLEVSPPPLPRPSNCLVLRSLRKVCSAQRWGALLSEHLLCAYCVTATP